MPSGMRFLSAAALIISCAAYSASAQSGNEDAILTIRTDSSLDLAGRLSGELEITATGGAEELLRSWLAGLPARRRQRAAAVFLDRIVPGAEILTAEAVDPDERSQPLRLYCRFRSGFFSSYSQGRLLVPTLLGWKLLTLAGLERMMTATPSIPQQGSLSIILEETVRLPVGFKPEAGEQEVRVGSDFASFTGSVLPQATAVLRSVRFRRLLREPNGSESEVLRRTLEALRRWRSDVVAERALK